MSVAVAPDAERLAESLRAHGVEAPELVLVLGSGLGDFVDALENATAIPGEELDGLPRSRVAGHAGRVVAGEIAGRRVLVQQGRVHLYEGWSARDVTTFVRATARLGAPRLLLTNAAGGLVEAWEPGTLMRIVDHVNCQEAAPLAERVTLAGSPYDEGLGEAVDRAARAAGVPLERGVYLANPGPAYETPAEVRMARRLGASAVGMSTAMEALAAFAAGMRVAAISCITNPAAGIRPAALSHEEVVEAGRGAAEAFARLLRGAVPELCASRT